MNDPHIDPHEVMKELQSAARAIEKASNRLGAATKEYEGRSIVNDDGEVVQDWEPGPALRFRSAVTAAMDHVLKTWPENLRFPAQDRLERLAEEWVKENEYDLYSEFHQLRTEIEALQTWIASREKAISARQSILKAEGVLTR